MKQPTRKAGWAHPRHLALAACITCLGWTGAWASGTAAPTTAAPPVALSRLLPPSDKVVQTLAQRPQVRGALAGVALAQARQQRLQVGPYDWSAQLATNRRSERNGARFTEPEVGLETTVRWPGKARADNTLGHVGVTVSEHAWSDAWHESARELLSVWFDTLRDLSQAQILTEQAQLAQQQLRAVERRVQAQEAARLEALAAQAEATRLEALSSKAQGQAQMRLRSLQQQYPGLPAPAILPTEPLSASEPATAWDGPSWVAQILNDNHALEWAQSKAEQARLQAHRVGMDRRADPTVGMRASRERNGQEWVVGVYLSLPFGSAGRSADAQAALAQADMAQQELEQTRSRIETEAWQSVSLVEQARSSSTLLRRAHDQLAQSARLQSRAYTLGESSLTELLLAQRSALEALLAAQTAALDEQQAWARLLLDAHQLWAAPSPAEPPVSTAR